MIIKGGIFMELREYRYFLAVAREESITKASEFLHISQPGLSKVIMNIEEELGKKLFVRENRSDMDAEGMINTQPHSFCWQC